jgi:glycine/D-amino acid oxidase-like deaminating enzyme
MTKLTAANSASSLWAATASAAPETPALTGARKADVAIIGAGFTGLTTALRLAENGASVIVIDAEAPGFGASGRNGGQVIPGLKLDPDELDAIYGEATTAFAGAAADVVFALIEKHGVDCDSLRKGWIQATVKKSHLAALERRMAQWQRRGAPVRMLDVAEIAAETGSSEFVGGWLDARGGSLHPLNYTQGLVRAALAAGAKIHGHSRATSLKKNGAGWSVAIAGGAMIAADEVVVATNGYTDALWPGLKATVIPANSFQIATAPLDAAALSRILPRRRVVSDSRRIGNYFRIGPGGRLMMGGRGAFRDPRSREDYRGIEQALHDFFAQTRSTPIEFRWSGRIAMTRDHLPHIHQPFPNLTIALGYNGRGVAMASATGAAIGAHLIDRMSPLPFKLSAIRPMPAHRLHTIYASLMIAYYRLRDALES